MTLYCKNSSLLRVELTTLYGKLSRLLQWRNVTGHETFSGVKGWVSVEPIIHSKYIKTRLDFPFYLKVKKVDF